MTRWKRLVLVLATVFCCIGCDQATKSVAEAHLPRNEVLSFAGDTLRLHYMENRGAFLGLGDELPESVRVIVLTGAVGVFLAGFLVFLLRSTSFSRHSLVACSLICGGGAGNLIDRLTRSGYVVDFLNCGIGPVRTGIFNVADVAITLGALVLVVESFVRRRGTHAA